MSERPPIDPYGFVRLVGRPDRQPGTPHHQFAGESGLLSCRLTTQTPLFVFDPAFARTTRGEHQSAQFPVRRGEAIIPGTSLKGVIRSVVEAVEASCLTLFDGVYRGGGITRGKSLTTRVPAEYRRCSDLSKLCPACRLFGTLNGGTVFTGKVAISDARAKSGDYKLLGQLVLDVLSAPKPEGRPRIYTQSDGKTIRGRKFYRHQLDGVLTRLGQKQDGQNKTVQPVDKGAVFTFTVEYVDLRPAELRLLLYALVLEETMWHKVGMGKPIGLGSVQLEVTEWLRIDRRARYLTLGGGLAVPLAGTTLKTAIDEQVIYYRRNPAENLEDLRELWRYDHNYEVRYQTYYKP
jgi:CRISPR/Cas system CSM-associated protein Csm3 (group 7 of RAMP superfamily)